MLVFHGSTEIIKQPDIHHSKNYLDFGKGFYLTTYEEQAKKWALRKGLRQSKNGIVNIYELKEDLENYKVLNFEDDEKWLDFVFACRKGESINQNYDIIIGNVADDDVFKTIDMYFRGLWNKQKVIQELRYYKSNNQICIVKEDVLNEVLKFVDSYEVK